MRMRVTFKFVGTNAQILEDLERVDLVAVDSFDWHKIKMVRFESSGFRALGLQAQEQRARRFDFRIGNQSAIQLALRPFL